MSLDEETIKKAWVKRVKELMPEKGFKTYQDLAYASGVSAGSLNQAMRGMHLPRQTTIDKIATALGTTSQFLLYGDTMRVVKTLPRLKTPGQIWQWVHGNQDAFESLSYQEVDSGLDLSPEAFVWIVDKNDMAPEFHAGDLVIIDTRDADDPSIFISRQPVYLMAVLLSESDSPVQVLFGQACMTSLGFYLMNCNDKFPISTKLDKDHHQVIGRVIQMVRTFN